MGRLPDTEIPKHFSESFKDADYEGPRCSCNHCHKQITFAVHRMKSHLNGCSEYLSKLRLVNDESMQEAAKKRRTQHGSVVPYADSMSKEQQEKAEYLLGKAIHGNGEAFSIFSDERWTAFFKFLRPAFKLPCAERIGGEMLTEQYMETQNNVVQVLSKNAKVGIQFSIDGLTDVKKRSVFNFMSNSPIPIFLATFKMNGKSESAMNLLEEVSPKILEIYEKFIANEIVIPDPENQLDRLHWMPFISFISDNPNVMKKLRKDITQKFQDLRENENLRVHLFALGCASHALNSLAHDLLLVEPFTSTKKSSITLVSYFNQTHRALEYLHRAMMEKHKRTYAICLFSKTRWNSVLLMWNSLQRARQSARSLLVLDPTSDPLEIPANVSIVLQNNAFWTNLEIVISFFKPLASATAYLEGDLIPLGAAYGVFFHLQQLYKNWNTEPCLSNPQLKEYVKEKLNLRWKSIYHPFQAVCFFFDPFWSAVIEKHGKENISLNEEKLLTQVRVGLKLAAPNSKIHCELFVEMEKYTSRRGEFADEEFMDQGKSVHPRIWWELTSDCPHLKSLLVSLYSHQNTSASGERYFKVHNSVLNESRNSLKDAKVEKQSFVAYNQHKLRYDLSTFKRNGKFEENLASMTIDTLERDLLQLFEASNISIVNANADECESEESDAEMEMNDDDLQLELSPNNAELPELIERVWCICQGEQNESMIGCDLGENCKGFEWYHFECVDIDPENIPAEFICEFCG
jgi:hypothetical protein